MFTLTAISAGVSRENRLHLHAVAFKLYINDAILRFEQTTAFQMRFALKSDKIEYPLRPNLS